jgi:putative glutamine amidotransferase
MSCLPLIGVTACTKQIGSHSYPVVADKDARALVVGAGGLPLVSPASGTHHDPQCDYSTLPLIKAAIAAGVPLVGIGRGFQASNLTFGGSLHRRVQEVAGYMEQRKSALPRTLSGLRCGLSQARESTLSLAISARL